MEPDLTANAESGGNPTLRGLIRDAIAAAGGRIPFTRFMESALYHPDHGYYLGEPRRPGRSGDFLTAPEAHPFFGLALSRQVAECWERLGRPDPFVVREYGAGVGALAYDIVTGLEGNAPGCRAALRYRLVEPNPHRRAEALAAMAEVGLGDVVTAEDPPPPGGDSPPITGVALANEVADALPVHRLVLRGGAPRECWVASDGERFHWQEGPLSAHALGAELLADLAAAGIGPADLGEGAVLDISPAAAAWFGGVARGLERGYAVVLDYGYPAAELYRGHRLGGTLRAYHAHDVSDDPFRRVGDQDLTAHVDFTALERAGRAAGLVPVGFTTQGAALAGLGLGDLLVELGRDPATTMAEYLAAQAATLRLIDPGGLGRFGVLVMATDPALATEPPLRAFAVAPPPF